jgi:hypothetical protein
MSLAYPIARSLEEATRPGAATARTQREAERLSPGAAIDGLEVSWLHLSEADAAALFSAQGADGAAGHLQRYEDTSGHVVVSVSWWKVCDPKANGGPAKPASTKPAASDHTDDLYFRQGRTKTKRRKPGNPNQLDLFEPKKDA